MNLIPRGAMVGAVILCAAGLATAAVIPSFQGLDTLPGGGVAYSTSGALTRNGSAVVGTSTEGNNFSVFRWTPEAGMTPVGISRPVISSENAAGISDDGSVIVGEHSIGFGGRRYAYRHTAAGGIQNLGTIPIAGNPAGETNSYANAVSGDGSVVVGQSDGASAAGGWRYQAFRWTPAGGMVGLGYLTPGMTFSEAADVSADGSVVVGTSAYATTSNANQAFRWTEAGGMEALGDLSGGTLSSGAAAVSSDGTVVVGNSRSTNGLEGFRWTRAGMVGIGDLPGGAFESFPTDVADDGLTIVGVGTTAAGREAFIWDPANGMRHLQTVLEELGLDLAGWRLTNVAAISSDGTTFAGSGINAAGRPEAWIAVVPEPTGLLVLGGGAALFIRRHRRNTR